MYQHIEAFQAQALDLKDLHLAADGTLAEMLINVR